MWDAKYQVWELGLTVTAGTILAMPLMWNSETLIEYCGYTNIFIISFAFYIIRFTGEETQKNNHKMAKTNDGFVIRIWIPAGNAAGTCV